MTDYEGPPITYAGKSYPVAIDGRGQFSTEVGGRRLTALTWAHLEGQVKMTAAKAKARIAVEYMMTGLPHRPAGRPAAERQFWICRVTGKNARTGDWTVVNADGDGHTGNRGHLGDQMRVLGPEDQAEWGRLMDAAEAARRALLEFRTAHSFDAEKAARAALEQSALEQEAGR